MENAELIQALKEDAEWAHANEWETPITLGDHLDAAADLIESLQADHESYQQVKKALQREGYSDIETMISQYKQVMIAANEHDLDRGEEVERLEAQLAASQRRENAAVEDMKVMALAMRESDELSEGCCFACVCDGQNLPGNVILPYGECPGYDTNDCFEWRGPQTGKGEAE